MMDTFYSPPERTTAEEVLIEGEEYDHLVHVLRKKVGDDILVADGKGTSRAVRIHSLHARSARCSILSVHPGLGEPSRPVILAVGILKNPSRFDFLVEKATELGAVEIVPVKTERTIPAHAKSDRWQKLALAAMKQCGRSYLPVVQQLVSLEEFLRRDFSAAVKILAHEKATEPIEHAVAGRGGAAVVLVGPEGGFSEEEAAAAAAAGYIPVSLGERRLRTETAAIVAAAAVLFNPSG